MPDLYGRTVIYTDAEEITGENLWAVLDSAISVHQTNVEQINYLYEYYKGKTDILDRQKTIRSDILNTINENRAKEIVDFKTSYLVGSEVVYSTSTVEYSEAVNTLNEFMRLSDKATKDYSLVEWQMIAGTAYRAVFAKSEITDDDAPFTLDTVDPRQAFVIYSSGIHHEPMASVYLNVDSEGTTHYWVYTHDTIYITNDDTNDIRTEPWTLYYLPIIEYPANTVRMGAFEPVIDLLIAIDELDSNRMDGVEQFIQALLVLINCKLPEGYTTATLAEQGLIELPSDSSNPADIKMLTQQLDQAQTQTLKDDMYNAVLTICAMPNRNGGASTSDNGLAVIYRDGWTAAETAARTSQKMIEQSENDALRLILRICREVKILDIPLRTIHIDFTKNHYENLELKTTVLIQLLSNDKVHPLVAYEVCGLFADPNEKYRLGMDWYKENQNDETRTGDTELQTDI